MRLALRQIAAPCSAIACSSDAKPGSSPPRRQQLVSRAHRGFVARAMVRMAGLSANTSRSRKRRRSPALPENRRSIAGVSHSTRATLPGVHRSWRAIDADLPAPGRSGAVPVPDPISSSLAATAKPPSPPPGHLRQRRSAQPRPGRAATRPRAVGLARAILTGQQDEARPGLDEGRRIGAEVREGEAADGHPSFGGRYCSRRSMTSKCAAR